VILYEDVRLLLCCQHSTTTWLIEHRHRLTIGHNLAELSARCLHCLLSHLIYPHCHRQTPHKACATQIHILRYNRSTTPDRMRPAAKRMPSCVDAQGFEHRRARLRRLTRTPPELAPTTVASSSSPAASSSRARTMCAGASAAPSAAAGPRALCCHTYHLIYLTMLSL